MCVGVSVKERKKAWESKGEGMCVVDEWVREREKADWEKQI